MGEAPLVTSLYTLLGVRLFAAVGVVLLLARGLFLPASFLIAMLLILLGCRLWANYGLHRLELSREVHPVRLFPGDEASLSVAIRNNKRVPVALECRHSFPEGLCFSSADGEVGERNALFLGRWGEWAFTFGFKGLHRGCYEIPPGEVNSKDMLGLFHRGKSFGGPTEVMVYPKLLELDEQNLAQRYLMGDIRSDRPFIADPTRVSSLRDFTPDTPARRIHWKASARHGKLLAKVLEHTSDLRLCIVLDGDSFDTPGPPMEKALSLAATLTVWADRQKVPFGLVSNVSQCGRPGPVSVPVGSGPSQVRLALESLARAVLPVALPFGEFFRQEARLLPWGTTVLVVRGESSAEASSEDDGVRVDKKIA